jgi:hypothetical protein
VPVGIDEPTAGSGQNTTDAPSGDAPTSGRTGSFPQTFGSEQTNWNPLNDQSRSQGDGPTLVVGHGMPRDMSNNYGTEGSSTGADSGLSPNTGPPSNQPTPNSSTASDSRPPNPTHNPNSTTSRSFELGSGSQSSSQIRSMQAFFASEPDYSNIPPTGISGMTPSPFSMPETPGRSFASPSGWSMGGQQQSTGLTPVGEGVFRHMMELGSMDPMEMEIWEGSS